MKEPVNEVKPFQALHYNPSRLRDIGPCLAPPYDVISPVAQEAYYQRHAHNVIRLILGKEEAGDDEKNNRYTRAAGYLAAWKREEALIPSAHPAFFVYRQSFSLPGLGRKMLTGFIGLVRLSAYGEGRVLPHELVMKKPVEDRVALTKATGTQFEYIWGLYRKNADAVDPVLARTVAGGAIMDYIDPADGVEHSLYRLKDPAQCLRIEEAMRDQPIYIADGHHRYQTMLNVRDELRRKHPDAGPNAPWEYIMMFLVNADDPGLVILPTHRLLHGLSAAALEKLKSELSRHFRVRTFPKGQGDGKASRAVWLAALEQTSGNAFGLALGGENVYLLLELNDPEAYKRTISGKASDTWKLLDVNILNRLVLGGILGFSDEMLSLQSNLEYGKDADEAAERVERGEMQAVFILKGTPLEAVLAVADAEEKMPRKSTFFYPKPLSGLVFYEMKASTMGSAQA